MTNRKISVCIATYNGEVFILKQILSIIYQLSTEDEIIISDDNSTDRTLEILKSLEDNRIKIYTNNGEKGYTPNFENALKHVTGDYIFLSDQDDIWEKNKVEKCMKYLEKYDFVVTDASIIDENENTLYNSFFTVRNPYKSFLGNILKYSYLGCCFAFKRKVLEKVLPFPPNHKLATHDNWIFLVAYMFFKTKILNEKLTLYRRHEHNISTGGMKNTTTFLFKIKYRFYLIISLLRCARNKIVI